MNSFDPARRCLVHDRINEVWVTWSSVDPLHFNKYADKSEEGLIGWRSLLMDAWMDQPTKLNRPSIKKTTPRRGNKRSEVLRRLNRHRCN
jgi:hypothetical protein